MKEICNNCGQKINISIYNKHLVKKLRKEGLPTLAKIYQNITKKFNQKSN